MAIQKKPTYIIGHKNPDSDSICSAIAYSYLKNKLGYKTIPACLSEMNNESRYILKKFGIEEPQLIRTAKCTLSEIDMDDALIVTKDTTMKEALEAILIRKNKGIFVVDERNCLEGIVSISDLTNLWTSDENQMIELMSKAKIENIIKTTSSTLLNDASFITNGQVLLLPSLGQNNIVYPGSIVIVGNSPELQRSVISQKAALVIICGEKWVDSVTLDIARACEVPIIHSAQSAISVAHSIFQSPTIEEVMVKNVTYFKMNETVDGALQRMAKTRFRTYPVLNDNNEVVGAISRFHLFNYEKKSFILVDHNEYSQSVNDLEFGEVIEIVDHHRLGGIETNSPVQFINYTYGSTCTIISALFDLYKIKIPMQIAGILLAGIISDTMCLKSPTTTETDIEVAHYLANAANVDIEKLSIELVKTTGSLINKSFLEIMYEDFKEFRLQESKIAIGQVVCRSEEEFKHIKKDFSDYLETQNMQHRYDLLLILFTDPTGKGSYFLYTGKKSWIIEDGFKATLKEDFVPGIISRKKQVLPVVIETINR